MQTGPVVAVRRRRLFELVAVGSAIGIVIAIFAVYLQRGFVPGDAFVYLGAGERLNAGHPLYAISPGDRPIGVEPPFWTVPLLSPPPIAVLWRPLAALPWELGVYVWWAIDLAAIALAIGLMVRRRPLLVSAGITVVSVPLVYEIGVANMNGLILLGLVLAWRSFVRGDDRGTGIAVGLMGAFKLTPAVLGWWLIVGRRWTAVRWTVATGLVVLAVSLLGAGLDAHLRYLDIVREAAAQGARPLSLAGMALYLGAPAAIASALPTLALAGGFVLMAILRRRPDLAFAVAVLTMVFGSPTVSINWFIYLLACLAPIAWPWRERADRELAPGAAGQLA